MKEYSNKEPIRRFIFIPEKEDIVDSKYNWILGFIDDQGEIEQSFRDLLINEREKYLQTKQEPDLVFLKNESEKILNKLIEKRIQEIVDENKSINSASINDLSQSFQEFYKVGDINILKEIIYSGCFYGWFCTSMHILYQRLPKFFVNILQQQLPKYIKDELCNGYGEIPKNIKDKFQIRTNDGAYKKIFGNAKLLKKQNYVELYINIDKQKFSIQGAQSDLYAV